MQMASTPTLTIQINTYTLEPEALRFEPNIRLLIETKHACYFNYKARTTPNLQTFSRQCTHMLTALPSMKLMDYGHHLAEPRLELAFR